jgi:hypothetical protein
MFLLNGGEIASEIQAVASLRFTLHIFLLGLERWESVRLTPAALCIVYHARLFRSAGHGRGG